jgi:hypothetical protein
MSLSKNHFRKFLIDEVMRALNVNISDAVCEVTEFSKTKQFEDSYKKWAVLKNYHECDVFRPKSIKEILCG